MFTTCAVKLRIIGQVGLNDINHPHRNHLEQYKRKMEKFKSNMNSKRFFPVCCKIYQSAIVLLWRISDIKDRKQDPKLKKI